MRDEKKVSERHFSRTVRTATQGLPHAIVMTTADVTDRKGVLQATDRCVANLQQVQCVLVGAGYTGQPIAQAVKDKLGATVRVARLNELHTFAVLPQR